MKAELKLKPHSMIPGAQVIEVWWGNRLVCTVAGADGPGVRIFSKHPLDTGLIQIEAPESGNPGVVEVKFEL